jgi:hypothetical protein
MCVEIQLKNLLSPYVKSSTVFRSKNVQKCELIKRLCDTVEGSQAFKHAMAKQSPSPSPPQDFYWQELAEQQFCQSFKADSTGEADRPALPPDENLQDHLEYAAAGEEGPQPDHPASPRPDYPASPDHPYEPEEGYVRRPLRDWERELEFSCDDDDDEDYAGFLTDSSDSEQWAPRPNTTSVGIQTSPG